MSKQPSPKRLDAYVRVSATRGREGERFTSPTDQEQAIRKWADLYGHEITDDGPDNGAWHELDVSGGTMDRPMLNEILARIDAGESDGIVVYRLDRFGRTLIGALAIIERLHEEGKSFASVMDNFDIATENGRLVLRIMLSLAQYERERIETTWRNARNNAVERGSACLRSPPVRLPARGVGQQQGRAVPRRARRRSGRGADRDRVVQAPRGGSGDERPVPVRAGRGHYDQHRAVHVGASRHAVAAR